MRPIRYVISSVFLLAAAGFAFPTQAADYGSDSAQKLAATGNAAAEVAWGKHLLDSTDPTTRASSTAWFRKAAEQGDSEGQWMLGSAFLSGIGTSFDQAAALEWMRKSLANGTPDHMATYGLTLMILGSMDGRPNDGMEWLNRSVAAGSATGLVGMGMLQLSGGIGVAKDPVAAEKSIRKAADSGSAEAQSVLGTLYLSDMLGHPDIPQALHWLELAAEQGRADAQATLGYFLISGDRDVPKDPAQGVVWADKAVAQQSPAGYYARGLAFLIGSGKAKDPAQAWYNFAVAARLDTKHKLTHAADRMSDAATQLKPEKLAQLRIEVEKIPMPAATGPAVGSS